MSKFAYMAGDGKAYKEYESASKHHASLELALRASKIEHVALLDNQIIRNGRIVTLASAVHHQRHAPCLLLIQCDKRDVPFRFTVLPVDNMYIPRRDIMPFDVFVDLGAIPSNEQDRQMLLQGYDLESLYDLFSDWFEKCGLGVSAIQEPRLFLPMYTTMAQYESAKLLHLDEFFTHPIRVMESIMAFTNDVSWAQGKDVQFGKSSYTQFATKCRHEIDRTDRGALRLDKLARAYNYHLLTR